MMSSNDPKANDPQRFEDEKTKRQGGGNFAKDPQRARELGRKGGEHSQQQQSGNPQRQPGEEKMTPRPDKGNDQQR
jgi:general stress protein YciG